MRNDPIANNLKLAFISLMSMLMSAMLTEFITDGFLNTLFMVLTVITVGTTGYFIYKHIDLLIKKK